MARESRIDAQKRYKQMRFTIEHYLNVRGKTVAEAAKYMCIGETTFRRRLESPGKFSLEELDNMARLLNVSMNDLVYGKMVAMRDGDQKI